MLFNFLTCSRTECLDGEVSASGFTKDMQKTLEELVNYSVIQWNLLSTTKDRRLGPKCVHYSLLGPKCVHYSLLGPKCVHYSLLGPKCVHYSLLGPKCVHYSLLGPKCVHYSLLGPKCVHYSEVPLLMLVYRSPVVHILCNTC